MESNCGKTCPESMKNRRNVDKSGKVDFQDGHYINVVSYNILAECHVRVGHYDTYTDPQYLGMDYRHRKVMEELEYLNGDVVCLQEVGPEYFQQTLEPEMNRLGYEGFYRKRTKKFFDEGCATFYLTSKFKLLSHNSHSLAEAAEELLDMASEDEDLRKSMTERYVNRADILMVTRLQCKFCEHSLIIANTHLVWESVSIPDVRCLQMFLVKKIISGCIDKHCDSYILCGDFNSEPDSPAYNIITAESLSDSDLKALNSVDSKNIIRVLTDFLQRENISMIMKSTYKWLLNTDPEATSVDNQFQGCLDYIFFGNNDLKPQRSQLVPMSVLKCPSVSEIKKYVPPSSVYPSDHLPIRTVFAVIEKKCTSSK